MQRRWMQRKCGMLAQASLLPSETNLALFLYGFLSCINLPLQPVMNQLVTLHDGSPLFGREAFGANGKLVTEFLGIPFAEPPIGKLRFRKPKPKQPWRTPLNATQMPNACVQVSLIAYRTWFTKARKRHWRHELQRLLFLRFWRSVKAFEFFTATKERYGKTTDAIILPCLCV